MSAAVQDAVRVKCVWCLCVCVDNRNVCGVWAGMGVVVRCCA